MPQHPHIAVEAVLFDIGNTLIDATALASEALRLSAELITTEYPQVTSADFMSAYLSVDRRTEGPSVNHLFSDVSIVRGVFDVLGVRSSPALEWRLLSSYRQHIRDRLKIDPSVVEVFACLRSRGLTIGVVTDGTTTEQLEQLDCLGVIDYVSAVVTSQEMGVEKPSLRLFEEALLRVGANAEATVMVGDDMLRDIWGASQAGMHTILVTRYSHLIDRDDLVADPPDHEIESVSEVTSIVFPLTALPSGH